MAKYFRIIGKWWWMVALLFLATVGSLLYITYTTEPEYESKVTMQVTAPPPQEVPLYSEFGRQALADEIYRTQTGFSELLEAGNVPNLVLKELPEIPLQPSELRDRVTVEIPRDSQLMHVSVRAAEPEMAAVLANKTVEVGLRRYGELSAQATESTRQFIEEQLEAARAEVADAEAQLIQFQIDNKVGSLDRAVDRQYDLVRSLKIERDLAWVDGNFTRADAIDKITLEREAELQNMIGLSGEYKELMDQVDRARVNLNFLLDRLTEAQIKENQILQVNSIQVITPARPSSNPVVVIDSRLIALGAVVSLLAGILLAFLFEFFEVSAVRDREVPRQPDRSAAALSDRAG